MYVLQQTVECIHWTIVPQHNIVLITFTRAEGTKQRFPSAKWCLLSDQIAENENTGALSVFD